MTNGVITFGCLNSFSKVNDGCLALWANVLQAVPRRACCCWPPAARRGNTCWPGSSSEGIAAARVEFVDRQPRPEYLQLYHRVDLGLDPVPCNGHTTSLDAFWMGVPIITLVSKRRRSAGRAGASCATWA